MHTHPKGSRATVLLTSVFGPFARNDQYGSRAINPMELYHNQVTRAQGPFSLRMHHRSWGLMLIHENISAPAPARFSDARSASSRDDDHAYDIVGISSIIVNVGKVREMCRLVRLHSPRSKIVVGGHVAAIPGHRADDRRRSHRRAKACAGCALSSAKTRTRPIRHPHDSVVIRLPVDGASARRRGGGNPAATIIPSVGCPMGCNFCTTSAFFGGKGKFVDFYKTGEELFRVMCEMEREAARHVLLHHGRELPAAQEAGAGAARSDEGAREGLVALRVLVRQCDRASTTCASSSSSGVRWVWLGLESPQSAYTKLKGTDTHGVDARAAVPRHPRPGFDHHRPRAPHAGEHQPRDRDAVAHETDSHQFMLYTPVPGTPLYHEMVAQGRILPDVDLADIHGQFKFNFQHAAIGRDESKTLLDSAFARDYERNGPSLYRLVETMFNGWMRYKDDVDARVRRRVAHEAQQLRTGYAPLLWAIDAYLRRTAHPAAERVSAFRAQFERELGVVARTTGRLAGPVLHWAARRDAARYPLGRALEPATFVDRRHPA